MSALRDRLGRVGAFVIWPGGLTAVEEQKAAAAIEALGYGALWVAETPVTKEVFVRASLLLAATDELVIATGIASVYARDAIAMHAAGEALAEAYPGRFVLGMGVSNAPSVNARDHDYGKPLTTMKTYLDAMERAAASSFRAPEPAPIVLGSVRPRMLRLAAERTAGAHPYFVVPQHSAQARRIMGPNALLAPEQTVIVDADPDRARARARRFMARYLTLPSHRANLMELGFSEAELAENPDALVDQIVAWGTPETVAERVRAHLDAGADHVPVQALADGPRHAVEQLRRLAPLLVTA